MLMTACSSYNSYNLKGSISPEKVSTLKLKRNPQFSLQRLELFEIDGNFLRGLYYQRVLTDNPGVLHGNAAFKDTFYIPPGHHDIRFKFTGVKDQGTRITMVESKVDGKASFEALPGKTYEFQTRWEASSMLWYWKLVDIETGAVLSGFEE